MNFLPVGYKLPTFKERFGDFGNYLLGRLKSGSELTSDECTAQLKDKGFANATKLVKDTEYTKTVVTALHVPNSEGKIHHYDIDVYRFKRSKPSDPNNWERQSEFSLREDEVKNLFAFLVEQNTLLGLKFDEKYATVVYSDREFRPEDFESIRAFLGKLSPEQLHTALASDENIEIVTKSLPKLRIDLLERLISELQGLLDKSEKEVREWLDKNPKINCLIFGLEYVDYKREVTFGNSQFDVLTDISGTEHVIIELKSPNRLVFQVQIRRLKNGTKTDYILSPDLAEAIPQTIKYFREYEREPAETFIKNGTEHKKVPKAIIVIGRNQKDNPVWQDHYCDLRNRIAGIEILTYDHLVEKIQNQIVNLRQLDS